MVRCKGRATLEKGFRKTQKILSLYTLQKREGKFQRGHPGMARQSLQNKERERDCLWIAWTWD
jgi:hypothetical protein